MTSYVLSPMLASAVSIEDVPRKCRGYTMEPKLDGIRCVASWDGRMYSRSAKTDLAKILPDIAKAVRDLDLPRGVWLDGEVGYEAKGLLLPDELTYWPILDFNATVRVTGSSPTEALRKQEATDEQIVFWVFDRVNTQVNPDDIQYQRRSALRWERLPPLLELVEDVACWDEQMYDRYVLAGGEGVILKNPNADYVPGKRLANRWYKVKKFDSFDGWIAGYDEGLGKYEGQVGALVVSHPGGFSVRCSGMTDAVRRDMTDNWEKYHGKMVEVKFFGNVGRAGEGIRHPQFLRMRPDLD